MSSLFLVIISYFSRQNTEGTPVLVPEFLLVYIVNVLCGILTGVSQLKILQKLMITNKTFGGKNKGMHCISLCISNENAHIFVRHQEKIMQNHSRA